MNTWDISILPIGLDWINCILWYAHIHRPRHTHAHTHHLCTCLLVYWVFFGWSSAFHSFSFKIQGYILTLKRMVVSQILSSGCPRELNRMSIWQERIIYPQSIFAIVSWMDLLVLHCRHFSGWKYCLGHPCAKLLIAIQIYDCHTNVFIGASWHAISL